MKGGKSMKVFVKNRFNLAGSSKVLDENGKDVLKVKGKTFSIRKKKRICDLSGKVLYRVQNKFWNWLLPSCYIFSSDGERIGKLVNKIKGDARYVLEDFADEITIDGEFMSSLLTVKRKGNVIGTIKMDFTIINDKFEVEGDEKDIPFLVALTIAIDNIRDKARK